MKAITQDRYGSQDVLELRNIDKPLVGDDDLLVRVHAAAVDAGVWHLMRGVPYVVRMAFGLSKPKNNVLGADMAGGLRRLARTSRSFNQVIRFTLKSTQAALPNTRVSRKTWCG